MPHKIEKKIVGYAVVKADEQKAPAAAPEASSAAPQEQAPAAQEISATEMNEKIARPTMLVGRTYKIEKSPANEHALYVTINDILLDEGTPFERRRPFEVFINSKNMDQFQWVVALTRIMSAVFRKGGDVTFLAEEMKSVFDPHGGYFRPGGYMPSLIAEIGGIVERHLQQIGLMEKAGLDEHQLALINEKKAALAGKGQGEKAQKTADAGSEDVSQANSSFPPNATMCNKCHQKSVVILDGCATCLNCGNSKCG